jgi:hypothetical protein
LRGVGVGANEDLHPARDPGVDVWAVPVAGVGEDDRGRFGDAGLFEFAGGGGDHRAEHAAVVAADGDVGGDDDLLWRGSGLGGVALNPAV